MSINVNVNGNPISIRGGRMVTANPNFDSSREFQKRRRIRIQQVRQQSKDIAENVRNKVRREQSKKLSEVERQGENERKKWQARKLLALQEQYNECLKDIGLGHAQATLEEESEERLLMERESSAKLMKERGVEAVQRLKEKIQNEKKDRLEGVERRKYNKAVENARSAMIVSLQKSQSPFKKKKKMSTNIDIVVSDTESEPEVPVNTRRFSTSDISIPVNNDFLEVSERGVQADLPESSKREPETDTLTSLVYPLDTRISDRIKRRRLKCASCDLSSGLLSNKCDELNSEPAVPDRELPVRELYKYDHERYQQPATALQADLPAKPTVKLRTTSRTQASSTSGNKVQYYDYPNRFVKEYEAPLSSVHRVSEGSIEVCPSTGSEVEYVEQMYQRDRDAQVRGQKAMEKVKVRRDYKEMLDQLSKLQKKERIASISSTKPQVHMSRERFKQFERKRQNRLENAYERLFPQTQIVTIPPRTPTPPSTSVRQPKSKANVGVWDFESKSGRAASPRLEQVSERDAAKRSEDLQKMLRSLTEQRDKVAKELQSLPKTSKLHKIVGDLTCIDQILDKGRAMDKSSAQQTRPQTGGSSKPKNQDGAQKSSSEKRAEASPERKTVKSSKVDQKTSPKPPPPPPKEFKQKVQQTVATQTATVDAVTETDALTTDKAVNTSLVKEKSKSGVKCRCSSKSKDQCEIIIKICDQTANQQKPVSPPPVCGMERKGPPRSDIKSAAKLAEPKKLPVKTDGKNNASWRDILIQNTSTSTSYCSPPDFQPVTHPQKKAFKNILKDIPQQQNVVNETAPSTTPLLQDQIKHLLAMSRGSIEELTVSTVSDVSTPTTSVIEMSSNNPQRHLSHIMTHFALHQTPENFTCSTPTSPHPSLKGVDIGCQCVDDYASENYPEVLTTYNKMAESCAKKIENLASMIERVRLEKRDILDRPPSGSDKEDSTKYLDLPSNRDNSPSPRGHDPLTSNLLRTDFDYREQLERKRTDDGNSPEPNLTNHELIRRFRKLKEDDAEPATDTLWLDIPKLPKFEENPNRAPNARKPPPSRGITIAMRHHQDINVLPHELSAIPEVDSFASNRPQNSGRSRDQSLHKEEAENKSCQADCKESSSSISLPDILSELDVINVLNTQRASLEETSEKSSSNKSTGTISIPSNSSSNDIDIETTLKSLGMGWAVTTLKKTQQALALTSSSSSSIDLSQSKLNGSGSILSAFLHGLAFDVTPNPNSTSSGNKTSRKTSTPLQKDDTLKTNTQPNILLTAESDISSIQHSANDQTANLIQFYSLNEGSLDQSKDIN
uniref:Uncharacterized protein n=1 Tax=Photinus pyralis TaxID=7054 RepID=A0A1Y1K2Z3_PHOPY